MYDVVIIGGGIIGCTLAKYLSRYSGKFLLIERNDTIGGSIPPDIGAIVHAGFDVSPLSPAARYGVEGNALLAAASQELSFPYRRCGALLIGNSQDDFPKLRELHQQGKKNRVRGLQLLWGDAMRGKESSLPGNAAAAMFSPTDGVTMPLPMMQAMAAAARQNGFEISVGTAVHRIARSGKYFCVTSAHGTVLTRAVICAAGNAAAKFHNQLCSDTITLQNQHIAYGCNPSPIPWRRIVLSLHHEGAIIPLPQGGISSRLAAPFDGPAISVPYYKLQQGKMIVGESCDGFFEVSGIGQTGVTMSCAIGRELSMAVADKLELKIYDND